VPGLITNFKWWKVYLFYWAGYLVLFSVIEGLPANDLFTAFRNELISLAPKVIFVTIVLEWLMDDLFLNKRIAHFAFIYFLLLVIFAFLLRLIDNYIILKYYLIYWKKEALISAPPFLYNVIKLQFLVTVPFSIKLFEYWAHEKKQVNQIQSEADEYLYRFNQAINSKETGIPGSDSSFLYVKCDRRTMKISLAEILYFEAQGNYIFIYTLNSVLKTYLSISDLEEKLSHDKFTRIHRSFIIARNKVESYTSSHVMICEKKIPIGRSYNGKAKTGLQFTAS
jgi:hypothetical protein